MRNRYRPRRASKRWMENAPDFILSCHDNKGKTCDRYTVFFTGKLWPISDGTNNVMGLNISSNPTHPQGVCMSFDCPSIRRELSGKKIKWMDLPKEVRDCAIRWYNED